MDAGEVLRVPEQDGRPDQAVRAGLVEPDAVRRGTGGRAPVALTDWAPASAVERLEGHEPGRLVRRGLAREADVARAPGVEHDEGDRRALVLVGRVRAGVVELVEDVGVDAARAPLAVVRLGRAVALDGHVVRVDLGPDAVEQDAALAADGVGPDPAGEETCGQLLDERAADLAADLLAAVGDGQRGREDRLGAGRLGGVGIGRRTRTGSGTSSASRRDRSSRRS